MIAAILLLMAIVLDSPTVYIHGKTDFWCVSLPAHTYYYDAIDHGKDYDSLHIFSLAQMDVERLSAFAECGEDWKPLPINQNVLRSEISDEKFDSKMKDMRNCQMGYWYIDNKLRDLYVLDLKENRLYIRTASVVQ